MIEQSTQALEFCYVSQTHPTDQFYDNVMDIHNSVILLDENCDEYKIELEKFKIEKLNEIDEVQALIEESFRKMFENIEIEPQDKCNYSIYLLLFFEKK